MGSRWNNIRQIWGITDKPPTVQTIPNSGNMQPTDSGRDGVGFIEYDGDHIREVHVGTPRDPWNWIEVDNGVWRRK